MICSTWGCFLHLQANLMKASDFCGRNMPLSRTMQGSFPSKQTMLRQEAVYSVYCFRRREKTWCSETRECSSWKTDVTVLEIASCGSPFKNLFEAAATTFVNGTALQAGVAGLEHLGAGIVLECCCSSSYGSSTTRFSVTLSHGDRLAFGQKLGIAWLIWLDC